MNKYMLLETVEGKSLLLFTNDIESVQEIDNYTHIYKTNGNSYYVKERVCTVMYLIDSSEENERYNYSILYGDPIVCPKHGVK